MEGRMLRRSVTLADQLAAVGPAAAAASSCNLRDLLKLRDEDDLAAGRRAAVTLASAMAAERRASSSAAAAAARTLLDIIRDDQLPPAPAPATAPDDSVIRRVVSLPARASTTDEATPAPEEEQGERVSLMALLEQTERQWSGGGALRSREEMVTTVAEALGLDDEVEAGKGGGVGGGCCVCMARPKDAAFIPCGHTFCRACARELSAGRGRCPLCNSAILDILDIF